MSVNWPRFVELVSSKQRILLTSHIRPDCDALGSELGMAGVLDTLGKDVRIVNGHPVPPNLKFLDPAGRIKQIGKDVAPEMLEDVELLLVLDTSAWAQLGDMGNVIRATKAHRAIMDHHVSEDDLGAELFKDTTAEATGRLVLEAAGHLGVKVTPQIATPLFAAVATDTGWFRFASTTGNTYRVAAQLVDSGAIPDTIYRSLYEQETLARLQLIGRVLSRATTELDGRLIHTAVFLDDFQATGALATDTEDVINMTLAVKGVHVAVIVVAQASGAFKISFRSRSPFDCAKAASQFGGGGHKAAAGATVDGPFESARSRVLDAVRAAMR